MAEKKNNILMLTSIFPTPDPEYHATNVCQSFVKEWQKMGYNVRVFHLNNTLPIVYSWIGTLFPKYAMKKMWSVVFLKPKRYNDSYIIDGIHVTYFPVVHPIPGRSTPRKNIISAYQFLRDSLSKDSFIPDIVVSHWTDMASYMPMIKHDYPNTKTSIVFHNDVHFSKQMMTNLKFIDAIGFRSESLKKQFENTFGVKKREFVCLSGIPSSYIPKFYPSKHFDEGVDKFIYVGRLAKNKNIDTLVKSLYNTFFAQEYSLDIVGNGPELNELVALVSELKESKNVRFHGKIPRENAQLLMNSSQVFVMVSSPEAFGLVYVEAMAQGCITIASRGEGADGFIVDGVNGFLCEPGNVEELSGLIDKIKSMSPKQLETISRNAYETACSMTDEKVAVSYLKNVE